MTSFGDYLQAYGGVKGSEVESFHGISIAKAASRISTLEHFVWSTLPSGLRESEGTLFVPHQEGKAQVDECIKSSLKDLWARTTFLWTGRYVDVLAYPAFTSLYPAGSSHILWILPSLVSTATKVPSLGDPRSNIGNFVKRILGSLHRSLPGLALLAMAIARATRWLR
ncbi:hypothetical protein MMC25_004914 [Agyrium rufum]|nr:hypothetical protein [Agyrium rufum]